MDEPNPSPQSPLRHVRTILWVLVALAAVAFAVTYSMRQQTPTEPQSTLGGPFTLTGGDGKKFSSSALASKPYAIFFGFTRCGDVCPVTLGRMAKLRRQVGGDDAFNIVFVTIDPANDGPAEVGQYAKLFGTPIIGLTGSAAEIAQVKRQYGVYAEPNPQSTGHGDMISHTSSVMLFDRDGNLTGTISGNEPDSAALQKLRALIA
ncbi:SCO family protein [Sphingomonas lutea]|uniref:SCO family protein n=1 Tax=Sphingomonas lutea TaxID=1045317 RepID=A0A7G9SGU3_9SPHN|nr:SCO family protein [Sphingomonas lutea]QNN67068.1 SCO family protein [Sphingomonas lutea]